MKQFIKFFFASCLGTTVALLLLGFILFSIGMSSAKQNLVSNNSTLLLEFKDIVPEKTDNIASSGFTLPTGDFIGLQRIKELIDHAKTDDRIKGILLKTEYPSLGAATASSVRRSLLDFKESGKFVYAYGGFYSQQGYYLASVADSVFMNPNGSVELKGFAIITPHFKNLFESLGIKMNVYYKGKYKSATESYRRNEMSPENKEQYKAFLNDLKNEYFQAIANGRNIPIEEVNRMASEYASSNSISSKSLKLVDELFYQNEMDQFLKDETGISASKRIKYTKLGDYHRDINITKSFKAEDRIAVVHMEGNILYDQDENGVISFARYQPTLDRIARAEDIKAVVLRINSPGGVAFVADNLWNSLMTIKKSGKYIAVSMGNYAASGGYYIACMADTIVAENTTLTGSIGVFLMYPEISKLLKDKLGITMDSVKTNPMAATMSQVFPQGPKDDQLLQGVTDELYNQFLTRVAEGREMTVEEANEVAQGRIWSGKAAKEVGLVDEIGGLNEAIQLTVDRLGLSDYRITEYPTIKKDIYMELLKALDQNTAAKIHKLESEFMQYNKLKTYLNEVSNSKAPQARLPIFFTE